MAELLKITLELSIHEAEVLRRAIQGFSPPKEDEMISIILFNKLRTKIKEVCDKSE